MDTFLAIYVFQNKYQHQHVYSVTHKSMSCNWSAEKQKNVVRFFPVSKITI